MSNEGSSTLAEKIAAWRATHHRFFHPEPDDFEDGVGTRLTTKSLLRLADALREALNALEARSPTPWELAAIIAQHVKAKHDRRTRSTYAVGFHDAADAILAALALPVRTGWVLVPREPTAEMRIAAERLADRSFAGIYRAMIDAVSPPLIGGEG